MAESVTLPPNRAVSRVRVTDPGYINRSNMDILDRDPSYVNESIKSLRHVAPVKVIRALARFNGIVSTAVFNYVEMAHTGYQLRAYQNGTHRYDRAGTQVAKSVMTGLDVIHNYTEGFADRETVPTLLETLLLESVLTGAVAGELVLNRARFPDRIVSVPAEELRWRAKGKNEKTKYPYQVSTNGDEIRLDVPTFWVIKSHAMANRVTPRSMLEAALNTAFTYLEFVEDMHRVVRRDGHTRTVCTLDQEKVRASAPPEIAADGKKLSEYMIQQKQFVEESLRSLDPEDVLVVYDTAEVDTLKKSGEKSDYTPLLSALSGLMATSLKSHPSILGLRLEGSQALSNTESMVFMKLAVGVQRPVQAFISRALTLACRLLGADVYVKFAFEPIDLRPKTELEAFYAMRQARILEQLSLGFITDEEASELLGTGERPAGAPRLSGTGFYQNSNINPDQVSPNTGPQERSLQPDTPDQESN